MLKFRFTLERDVSFIIVKTLSIFFDFQKKKFQNSFADYITCSSNLDVFYVFSTMLIFRWS